MNKAILFAISFIVSLPVQSGAIYKCTVNGKNSYQDSPCEGSDVNDNKLKVKVVSPPDSIDTKRNDHWNRLARQFKLRQASERREVMIGMSPNQVRRAWGKPESINKSFVAGRSSEQWVYKRKGGKRQYIYFDDGLVSAWN